MSTQEHFAFKQSKFIALKQGDRDLYFNYKLRRWFDNNNVTYELDTNGNSTGKLIEHQIRYSDFCEELTPILKKTSYIRINRDIGTNPRLTEPVKILLKAKDVNKTFGTYLNAVAEKVFYDMVKIAKEKKNSIPEPEPTVQPITVSVVEPVKIVETPVAIKIVVPEFDEDEWD